MCIFFGLTNIVVKDTVAVFPFRHYQPCRGPWSCERRRWTQTTPLWPAPCTNWQVYMPSGASSALQSCCTARLWTSLRMPLALTITWWPKSWMPWLCCIRSKTSEWAVSSSLMFCSQQTGTVGRDLFTFVMICLLLLLHSPTMSLGFTTLGETVAYMTIF